MYDHLNLEGNLAEVSYLVGVYYGDGCVAQGQFILGAKDLDFVATTREYIQRVTSITHNISHLKSGVFMVRSVNKSHLGDWVRRVTDQRNLIPLFILTNKANTIQFLRGLMDSEGSVSRTGNSRSVRIAMKDGFFLGKVRLLFEKLGIRVSPELHRSEQMTSPPDTKMRYMSQLYYICINAKDYEKQIGFNIARKQKRLEEVMKIHLIAGEQSA